MQLGGGPETEAILRAVGVPLGARQAILYKIRPGYSLCYDCHAADSHCDLHAHWSLPPTSPILWGYGGRCSTYEGEPLSKVHMHAACARTKRHISMVGSCGANAFVLTWCHSHYSE